MVKPNFGSRLFRGVEESLGHLARKRGLSVLAVILVALAGRIALLRLVPVPAPAIHDEFSYLLMADTFASGRLSNPTHPMWKHFESFHIIHLPTYGSKHPLAQGVILALGEVFGHPWFGVWLSAGLMCGAICWMLQGWLPPGWALLGGALAVIRLGLFSYWANSYWGGAAAAIGGCLLLGALGRMRRTIRWHDALWMALGASILANSRPYEGLLVSLGAGAVLLFRWRSSILRAAIPMLIVFSLTAAVMCAYFKSVTGSAFRSPYQVYESQYGIMPMPSFFWQPMRPEPAYRHEVMRAFYLESPTRHLRDKTVLSLAGLILYKIKITGLFFLGPALGIGLLAARSVFRDRRTRPLVWIALLLAAGSAGLLAYQAHYAAPITGLILALLLQGFRHLRCWRPGGRPVGRFLVRSIPVICLLMVAVRIAARPGPHEWDPPRPAQWCCAGAGNTGREKMIARLEEMGGRHLVIVRYRPDHAYDDEWVYNAADIDNAKVVFAREMDAASDRELITYFKDRQVWLLKPDESPVIASRYAGP